MFLKTFIKTLKNILHRWCLGLHCNLSDQRQYVSFAAKFSRGGGILEPHSVFLGENFRRSDKKELF